MLHLYGITVLLTGTIRMIIMRTKIVLACVDCQSRNYTTYKESSSARLEIKKYCKTCSKHTMHRETK